MKISLFLIGDEIISGEREDINAHYLMKNLGECGLRLSEILITGDDKEEIGRGIKFLLSSSDIVITSGGLGLTPDDITIEAIAEALDRKIVYDETAKKLVRKSLKRLGRNIPEETEFEFYKKIEGATLMENFVGVAPIEKLVIDNKTVFILPGVPKEFREAIDRYIFPVIAQLKSVNNKQTVEFLINARESEVVNILKNVEKKFSVKTASYPPVLDNERYLKIKLTGANEDVQKAKVFFEKALTKKGIRIEKEIS